MDDFLLSALDVFQGDLEPEGFLIAVLDEIKKKSSLEHVSSASFQSKALTEIRRRIEMEKGLNKEIERLSKEVSFLAGATRRSTFIDVQAKLVLCATASENSQRSLQDEFSQVQYQHALHLKDQTENVCS